MPTKTTYKTRSRALGLLEKEHFQTGPDHLFAGAPCRFCEDAKTARAAWEGHRDAIIKAWQSRYPFPCFAQVMFDGAAFPEEANPIWDAHSKLIFKLVSGSLARESTP